MKADNDIIRATKLRLALMHNGHVPLPLFGTAKAAVLRAFPNAFKDGEIAA